MDLISLTTAGGLSMDTLESHSSEVEEHHAHSIEEIFDAISYKKGSTVIRMLQGYLGADMFQFFVQKIWLGINFWRESFNSQRSYLTLSGAFSRLIYRCAICSAGCLYCCNAVNTSTVNRNGFESILKLYREADIVQEKEPRLLCCIAYCPDPNIVREFLNFMLSDEVQNQDIIFMLSGISSESHEVVWRWLKQ
ncbi:hypothetical protein CMV_026479 [Castanea mollissima]|uniref:Uncharacterized protein n=1 Tax=Castanea mollissima TaxID=60419 RepID=A0A8J4VAD3_9ROSI|nr:hypothetical protein CMV_026479 [Castanea mollissima]